MSIQLDTDSTEYIYLGITGTAPSVSAEMAFLAAGTRPSSGDWNLVVIVADSSDPLWADAVASGATGSYYLAQLIGSFVGTSGIVGITLAVGDYQVWLRLTGDIERPVRIAPVTMEIAA